VDTTLESHETNFVELGAIGTGGIQASDTQQERLREFTERVGSGEFHNATTGKIPCTCIDGRFGATDELMPNAAGGTETLMVADDLTVRVFADANSTTCDQYDTILQHLRTNGLPVGGHTAQDCHGAPSGCGANDKLPAIYTYIIQNGNTLRQLCQNLLDYQISDHEHETIIRNARQRSEFSDGGELLSVLKMHGGRIDVLQGEHTEVLAVINCRVGTTLDRNAVRVEFGDNYEAFNVDIWAFAEGAAAIGNEADIHIKQVAMMYYNLATAGVLCGPKLRVSVLN
jgi:hypothetical protein